MRTKIIAPILILTSCLVFSGCDVPVYSKYQVKKFLTKIEPDFVASQQQIKVVEESLFNSSANYEESSKAIDGAVDKIQQFGQNLDQVKFPEVAADFKKDLKNYYQDSSDLTQEIKILVDFYALAGKTSDDFFAASKKIPTDLTQDNKKIIDYFTKQLKQYQDNLADLKKSDVPEYCYQAKIALTSVVEAYIDFLESVIRGLTEQNPYYLDVDQFVRQMDDGVSGFISRVEVIERRGDFDQKIKDLSSQQENIENQIEELKNKYKID